ncbi:hypothetical protein [Amycolatopsis sp. 195334CR]|uniref:hypothetical protein n=1 Tax=Amycolatopsis sp. 195334CR TaxID=2814588 RepID=UPI001A8F65CC|nr:hypothetical protein [Amycolatopsis sp. 195334CR]MBN6035892.1 hypothetical protein [Amycolatopsis sp. 195334CR]
MSYEEPAGKPPTGLLIGIATGVVVLAVLGFTAFIAPGFLTGDPAPVAAPPTSSAPARATTTTPPSSRPAETPSPVPSSPAEPAPGGRGGSGPADASVEQVIKDFVAKLNAGDATGAKELMCAGGRGDDSAVGALAAQKPSLAVGELQAKSSKVLTGQVTGTAGGKPVEASVTATAAIGEACVGLFTVS